MNKLQQEIENLKEVISRYNKEIEETGCIDPDEQIWLVEAEAELSQTKKCIEIFKEMINNIPNEFIMEAETEEDATWLKEELKSQLDEGEK